MDKDKSILEKITDTVKDIANIAATAADHALKADEPTLKAEKRSAAYIPLAADGLVSDPMMVPPVAVAPARKKRKKKRGAPKRAAKKAGKTAKTTKAVRKSARKAAKKSAASRSRKAAKKTAKKTKRKARKKG
jgi:hypothetical protein